MGIRFKPKARAFIPIFCVLLAGLATAVVVNSHFTAGVYRETFQSLSSRPQVLYPSLNFEAFDMPEESHRGLLVDIMGPDNRDAFVYLSINRYERKKNLTLALEAFGKFNADVHSSENY